MKRYPVLVEGVRAVSARRKGAQSGSSKVTVTFTGGSTAKLDLSDAREKVWAEVLESLRARREPAYVELDPATRRINALLLPRQVSVVDIREVTRGGDLQLEFVESHAFHFLRRANQRFDEMRELLETALRTRAHLLVTDSLDSTQIVDVRPAAEKSDGDR